MFKSNFHFLRRAHLNRALAKFAVCLGLLLIQKEAVSGELILGDYDKEPRKEGHVDSDYLVQRLTDLGANTYFWLISHSAYDWPDLPEFLEKSKRAGINVWVYLPPPSETPQVNKLFKYPEPFRLDYQRWAIEIAKLSLKYPNLKGYVIDDFWKNVKAGRFSLSSIQAMTVAARSINPSIKFFPLMYFTHEMDDPEFYKNWPPIIDGVVAAYPASKNAVIDALQFSHGVNAKKIPMIVMPSGDQSTLTKFNHIEGTPENVSSGVRAAVELAQQGLIDGVVTYCLDKSEKSTTFGLVQKVYREPRATTQ